MFGAWTASAALTGGAGRACCGRRRSARIGRGGGGGRAVGGSDAAGGAEPGPDSLGHLGDGSGRWSKAVTGQGTGSGKLEDRRRNRQWEGKERQWKVEERQWKVEERR